MASSRNETQILWSSASSQSCTAATTYTSDAFTFNIEDWDADLQINADNNGTPSAGDTLDVWVAYSSGDILGDTGDDYDSTEHAQFLCRLDTVTANTPGEDPARATVPLRTASKGFKVIVKNNAASNGITVRARVITHRPQ